MGFKDFNTSHVVVKASWTSLFLLNVLNFNTSHVVVKVLVAAVENGKLSYFNTSHVVVKAVRHIDGLAI